MPPLPPPGCAYGSAVGHTAIGAQPGGGQWEPGSRAAAGSENAKFFGQKPASKNEKI